MTKILMKNVIKCELSIVDLSLNNKIDFYAIRKKNLSSPTLMFEFIGTECECILIVIVFYIDN